MAETLSPEQMELDARWKLGELMRAGWKLEMEGALGGDVLITLTAPFTIHVNGEEVPLRIGEPANPWMLWPGLISVIHAAHALAFPVPKDGQPGDIPPAEL